MKARFQPSFHFVAALAAGLLLTPSRAAAKTFTVVFDNFSFTPKTVTIQAGDTVLWNNGGGSHTVTGDGADKFCGTGIISTSCSKTFTTPGTFPYHCAFHAGFGMVGKVIVTPASNPPPLVSITNPTNNTTLSHSGSVTIEATATSAGTIASVEFFDGDSLIGTDASFPYSVELVLNAGTHLLTAKATDTDGGTGTSPAVTVIVQAAIADPIPARITQGDITIELQTIADGLVSPLGTAAPDDGSGTLLVYDQVGLVHVIQNGTLPNTPMLDVRSRLVTLNPGYDERGLLGLATHPNFAAHPFIYTYTSEPNGPSADFIIPVSGGTTNNHQSVIAEWRIDPAHPNQVDPTSRRELLRLDKPQFNHNGGTLRFGTDGFLYFTVGDGGAADDQGPGHSLGGNGQDLGKILGKIGRIDVDARTSSNGQYGVPSDNPFVDQSNAVKEIYAYGLRNPFSFSFDRLTGDLWLADVGQNDIEEVDQITKGGNFGWPVKEGTFFFDPNGDGNGFVTLAPVGEVPPNLVDPIAEFDHDEGVAIIGGYVYRGPALANLSGKYVTGSWGEFQAPEGRLFYRIGAELKEFRLGEDNRKLGLWLKGFGQDAAGELYVCGSTNLGPTGSSGKLLKVVSVTPPTELKVAAIADGNSIRLNITGGIPPYLVQGRPELDGGPWIDLVTTNGNSVPIPIVGSTLFLQVEDQTTKIVTLYHATLDGASERPNPVVTSASGSALFAIQGLQATYLVSYQNLKATAIASHLHGYAGPEGAAGILFNLVPAGEFGVSGILSGVHTLTTEELAGIVAGQTYVNVHSQQPPGHSGGEIRGQLIP
ncbi:MAG TPA: PQQ-dependent sugar dehydrogenase [Verrucomicrobiota bacterium]|nr:hypothetical protein [Verrucomicrobiales bacterium]HRI11617.1 PQQ-dependent sugar dehydrogenase [Verrucomicrobiota bacterium]